MVGQQRPFLLPQGISDRIAQLTLLHRAAVFVIKHRIGIDQGRCLVVHRRNAARSRPDGTPLRVVMNDYAHIVTLVVNVHVQLDGGGDVPLALDHMPLGIQPQNVGGRQLTPGQLPRIGQICSVIQTQRDMACDMVVIALTRKHAAQQRNLLALCQFLQQRPAPLARCIASQQFMIQTVVAHAASLLFCVSVVLGWRANTEARCMRR